MVNNTLRAQPEDAGLTLVSGDPLLAGQVRAVTLTRAN